MLCFKLFTVASALTLAWGCSPFNMVDKYVEEFQHGLNNLHEMSHGYKSLEENFNSAKYNESLAAAEAEEFDFVIVGGGSSGSVLANRLSEVPEWKILLLEAGAPETEYTKVPQMHSYLHTTPYSWDFKTVPQDNSCLGMVDKKCSLEYGKVLGGSSAINDMLYIRGNPRDYDVWADNGNLGWCWEDAIEYFKKIEDCHIEHFDRKYHRYGGLLHVENPRHTTEKLKEHVLDGAHELGIKTIDYNGKHQLGFGVPQLTTKDGKRLSSADAYLEPASKRDNLVIRPLAHVIKVLVSTHTKEATGVKYLHDGKMLIAKARKEVILSAGAVNSAHLLLLSGIGPKEDLEKHHIECVADLKVGHELKDHLGFNGLNFILNATEKAVHHEHGHGMATEDEAVQYLKTGKGPLAAVPNELVGFVKTKASKEHTDVPDLQLLITPNLFNKGPEHLRYLNIRPDVYEHMWKNLEGLKGFSIIPRLANPKSRGHMKLFNGDPMHQPLIDLNQLSDEDENDLETMLEGIKLAFKLAQSEAVQKLGIHVNKRSAPGCDKFEWDTRDFWICQIKHLSYNLRQISGTAKMGPPSDKTAVVDQKLKVWGVHKLRVADASVIPVTITGNYLGAELYIGEQAADFIKDDWK